MKNNTTPIDVYTLTMEHILKGTPGDADSCPVTYMLTKETQKHNEEGYYEVLVCDDEIEYGHEDIDFSKCNSWTLAALIQAIDMPHIPIYKKDTHTKEKVQLFGSDKVLFPPYQIEEYENWFNLHMDEYPMAHLDEYHKSYKVDEDNNVIEIIFYVSQHTEPTK